MNPQSMWRCARHDSATCKVCALDEVRATDGMLLDAVRLVAKLPQKMPYTDDEKHRLKLAVKACRAYLRPTAPQPDKSTGTPLTRDIPRVQ